MQGPSLHNPMNALYNSMSTLISNPSSLLQTKPSFNRSIFQGSLIESLIERVKTLVSQNYRLIFWFSNSMLFATTPGLFIVSASLGLFMALHNHFGLKDKLIRHLAWEITSGVVSSIVFFCELLFRYPLQCLWQGLTAGSYLYRLWSGQIHGKNICGLRALDEEMEALTREFAHWFRNVVPYRF